jgi:hypothetical protein
MNKEEQIIIKKTCPVCGFKVNTLFKFKEGYRCINCCLNKMNNSKGGEYVEKI